MPRSAGEQVVVLTGASSGIGRATAVELGRRGAAVVLAARSEDELRDAAEEVRAAGGRPLVVPTDVADFAQVEHLARTAVAHFGRVDTWVNNASVSVYGTVEDAPVADIERVIQTDLLGAIYGMKVAAPLLKGQGGGTIVNVSSVLGRLSVPLQAAYCAAKHGVIGFADSLRLELARDGSGVAVCTLMPSSIDTPFFAHARARLGGKMPQPLPPAYDPQAVADAIVKLCERPQRDVIVGGAGRLFVLLHAVAPGLLDWVLLAGDGGAKLQTSSEAKTGGDNLDRPVGGAQPARGGWDRLSVGDSWYTRYWAQAPLVRTAALGALGVAGLAVARLLGGRAADDTPRRDALVAIG
ncbi:SDR family NAD(P)-dependent oxidoreductase [bacterium]|nr:SDR family NAD(P)-dependent oxidoreductase [bacterium]